MPTAGNVTASCCATSAATRPASAAIRPRGRSTILPTGRPSVFRDKATDHSARRLPMSLQPRHSRGKAPQRGFTLVEAMVALIVLSVGLLGIAALYVETLRASRTSLHRTQAVNLATDLADRMRANRDARECLQLRRPLRAGDRRQRHRDRRPHRLDGADWRTIAGGHGNVTFTARNGDDARRLRRSGRLGRGRPGQPRRLPAAGRDLRTPP